MAVIAGTARKGSGKRQRFGGIMGVRKKDGKKWKTVPRSHTHGGRSPARRGWSVNDAGPDGPKGKSQTTKHLPAKFRTQGPPTKRHHRRGSYGSIT